MTLPWEDIKTEISSRLGDPAFTPISGKLGLVKFDTDVLDDVMCIVAQELMREIPTALYDNLEAAAITGSGGSVGIPLNVISVQSVTIDDGPAVGVSLAGFYQRRNIPSQSIYAFSADDSGNGLLLFTGTSVKIIPLLEPSLAEFKADGITLPPGYDEEFITRTVSRLAIMS